MAQQELNSTDVRTGFEQVGSEAVPQGMWVNAFIQARPFGRLLHCVIYASGIDGNVTVLVGTFAGKQDRLWLGVGGTPVGAKFLEQSRAEHDVAIFLAFALTNV